MAVEANITMDDFTATTHRQGAETAAFSRISACAATQR